jgi:hypothetical protein
MQAKLDSLHQSDPQIATIEMTHKMLEKQNEEKMHRPLVRPRIMFIEPQLTAKDLQLDCR